MNPITLILIVALGLSTWYTIEVWRASRHHHTRYDVRGAHICGIIVGFILGVITLALIFGAHTCNPS